MNRFILRRALGACAAALLLAGCIGLIPREDFEAEIRSRGGGLNQNLVLDAIDEIAATVGTREFAIQNLNASPTSGVVSVTVRDPRDPALLDRYTLRNGAIISTDPVQLRASDDLDEDTFPIAEVALDQLNDMVDVALAEYGVADGYVDSFGIRLGPVPGEPGVGRPFVYLSLESARSSADATFEADGELVSVERS